jgi:hypothetical protein
MFHRLSASFDTLVPMSTAIARPTNPTDRVLAHEAVRFVNHFSPLRPDDRALDYLRNMQIVATELLREGGESTRSGHLLAAAFAVRALTEFSIRLSWVWSKRTSGEEAMRDAIDRLRAHDVRELERTHKAVRRSAKKDFITDLSGLYKVKAEIGAEPAPGDMEDLAREAGWPEQYATYRLMSAMIHGGADGWMIARKYEDEGGLLPLVRWAFSNVVAGMQNVYALLVPDHLAPGLPANARCHADGGKFEIAAIEEGARMNRRARRQRRRNQAKPKTWRR